MPYAIRRALPSVEAISRNFTNILLPILTSRRLTYYTPYPTFERLLAQTGHGMISSRNSRMSRGR
ncbi:uncharacterized protein LACBIDRAFT_310710 [Laccaria bicolor S238N-H82]|uniref:Predicted protein n=1 Tax=Laccaria bicolor (strain S238N-H82 / ATCC MYA-4686) TaxID=486041 RepID=B0DUY1_LACBS|nr:uncharacterized protein LACBIDRAFT_310710 [Laccaria bicolor S238N-H82]EDR01687.1 predicted protein [Laccaria bicolor S238N-H82]|eukprot:XP_001887763.1 predicted protein [Laccaria bicolor S238N-H82]